MKAISSNVTMLLCSLVSAVSIFSVGPSSHERGNRNMLDNFLFVNCVGLMISIFQIVDAIVHSITFRDPWSYRSRYLQSGLGLVYASLLLPNLVLAIIPHVMLVLSVFQFTVQVQMLFIICGIYFQLQVYGGAIWTSTLSKFSMSSILISIILSYTSFSGLSQRGDLISGIAFIFFAIGAVGFCRVFAKWWIVEYRQKQKSEVHLFLTLFVTFTVCVSYWILLGLYSLSLGVLETYSYDAFIPYLWVQYVGIFAIVISGRFYFHYHILKTEVNFYLSSELTRLLHAQHEYSQILLLYHDHSNICYIVYFLYFLRREHCYD